MPEHVHLLLSEPESDTLASALRSIKVSAAKQIHAQSTAAVNGSPFWQARYYDRNIRDYREFVIKLRYLHRNPVKRGHCQSQSNGHGAASSTT
jgi:putative transposase